MALESRLLLRSPAPDYRPRIPPSDLPPTLIAAPCFLSLVAFTLLVHRTNVGAVRPIDATATMAPTPENIKKTSFEYLYNHIFLPKKLSSVDDATPKTEGLLLDFALHSLQRFLPGRHDAKAIGVSISMLRSFRRSRNNQGYLKDTYVREALQGLTHQGTYLPFLLR